LTVIFGFLPNLAARLWNGFSKRDRNEFFDILGVFYPITSHKELRGLHVSALTANPAWADDLASLIALKVKNSLADTCLITFESLPTPLVHPTSNEHILQILAGFFDSLLQHSKKDPCRANRKLSMRL
jgi:hypothetical protein